MEWRPRTDHKLLARARRLRREMTFAERLLWSRLRRRQVAGYKFWRQVVLGGYIVDFLCWEKRVVVEVDGESHRDTEGHDRVRVSTVYGSVGFGCCGSGTMKWSTTWIGWLSSLSMLWTRAPDPHMSQSCRPGLLGGMKSSPHPRIQSSIATPGILS